MLITRPVLINNYFGRQFNSLNDVSINPRNKEIYFTDTMYGYWQYFRPQPGLQNQVYRFNPDTGAIRVAADGFVSPNGRQATRLPPESGLNRVADLIMFRPDVLS